MFRKYLRHIFSSYDYILFPQTLVLACARRRSMRTARSLRCERACASVRLLSARANVLTPQRARGAGGCARKRACACMCAGLRLPPLATKRAERRGKGAALPQRPEPRGDELARNWRGHRGRGGGGIRPARATARASRQGSSTGRGRAPTMVEALARVTVYNK